MKINDCVYGEHIINEPVLIELINSKPLQRLKRVNQAGASQYAIKGKTVTRYEHSVGVSILLKKLGASVNEQIAGLLHDVPHTAFSHVIDFVFKNKNYNHEFHEKFYEKIILSSEIPEILKKHNFNLEFLLDETHFPLLEKSLPDLCADRIDYTLRDMTASYGFTNKINEYVSGIIIHNNEIIFKNKFIAKNFAEDYLFMDKKNWSNPFEIALFQILADAIKIGLNQNILAESDLFNDDLFVYTKLKKSKNPLILKKLKMLSPRLKILDNPKNYDFYSRTKLRYVDPKFLDSNGSVVRLTEIFQDYSDVLKNHKKTIERGNFIKILSY